ncbi:MAG: hypothetical protein KGN02_05070 [bacterium]|nr:hypothetical protein [bacterium]
MPAGSRAIPTVGSSRPKHASTSSKRRSVEPKRCIRYSPCWGQRGAHMNSRLILLVCAAAGIPLALLALLLPITWGYGGYNFSLTRPLGTVYFSDPAGPAYAAGIRAGQKLLANSGYEFVNEDAGPIGTVVHEHVLEPNGHIRVISFAFVPFSGALGIQQAINKLVDALTALGAFVVALLVLLRARNQRVGIRAAAVLSFSGVAALSVAVSLVCANALMAEILNRFVPAIFGPIAYWAALELLAILPPYRTAFRGILRWFGAANLAFECLALYGSISTLVTGIASPFMLWRFSKTGAVIDLCFALVFVAAIVDALLSAREEDVAPVRWLGGMWLVAAAFMVAQPIQALLGGGILLTHYGDFIAAGRVGFLAIGVAYPILRHRIVDLNILVSRATVFTIVSAIIVGMFIAAEWAIGKIFERSFDLSQDRGGPVGQLLTFAIVLALGLSARSIHAFVEERLTKAFFRKRLRGLADIERVAREADAATDADDVMRVGVETVKRALNPLGIAYYLGRGDGYELVVGDGADEFPRSYRFNDAEPLRLRRWQEPFEADDDSAERLHMLYIPMAVRGTLIGFLCCGPKPDRTSYLEDEIKALALLAHHAAIATALLQPKDIPSAENAQALSSSSLSIPTLSEGLA